MKRFFMTALMLAFIPVGVRAQALSSDQEARIAEVFQDLDDINSPGASVAVIRAGEVVYSEGFGSAQLEYGIPVTPSTIFHVASVSKQFTAMAVLLLEADGKLSLDADIRDYMPEVPDMGVVVTPRHLLHHTSGVRDQWELLLMAGWQLDDVITKEHVRRLLSKQRELNFEPGAEYLYSNMGFSLAADLVERVSGMPFQDFVAERVFAPLGMDDTHVHDDHQHVVPDRAYSYRAPSQGGYRKMVLSYANHGATSLFTTAEDLVTWLDNFRTAQVGSVPLLETMQTRGVLNDSDTIDYGLGLRIGTYRGAAFVGHGGSDAGFRSNVIWLPEHETGVVVLSNLASSNPAGRTVQVVDVVLEDVFGPVPEVPEQEEEAEESSPEVGLDAEALAKFVGRFSSPLGILAFEIRDGALWASSPDSTGWVATSDTTFDAVSVPFAVTFHVSEIADSVTLLQLRSGQRVTGRRLSQGMPDMSQYVGTYYSPEIETLYEIRADDEGLLVYHLKHGEVRINMDGGEDNFTAMRFFLRQLRFTRDESGAVDGFLLTSIRVRNLRFVRMAGGLPGE